jgi:hypothetical protein
MGGGIRALAGQGRLAMGKARRKKKGSRYTPAKSAGLSSNYRSDSVLTPGTVRMTDDPDKSAAEEAAFFGEGAMPERVFAMFPTEGGDSHVDSALPPTLVAVVDETGWPSDLQAAISHLMASRAAHPDEEWIEVAKYSIGWSSLFRMGKPREIAVAATKLRLDVLEPVEFHHSFIFDLRQVHPTVAAVASGGIFALGTASQVEYLMAPERTLRTSSSYSRSGYPSDRTRHQMWGCRTAGLLGGA